MDHYLFPSIFTSQMEEIDFPEIISKFCMEAWKLFQDKLCVGIHSSLKGVFHATKVHPLLLVMRR